MGRCVCSSCICVQPAIWHADNAAYVFEVAVVALSLAGVHVEAAGHPRRPEPPNVATHGGSSKLESYQGPSSTIGVWGLGIIRICLWHCKRITNRIQRMLGQAPSETFQSRDRWDWVPEAQSRASDGRAFRIGSW